MEREIMSLRYGGILLLLTLLILFAAYKNYEVWSQPKVALTPRYPMNKKPDARNTAGLLQKSVPQAASPDAFRLIEEKNIFNPTRKEFASQVTEMEPQQKMALRPPIILYGVVIAGEYRGALVANPGRPLHKGEREEMTVKLGDHIGNYQVNAIYPDRITVAAEGDSFDVLLYDPQSPKRRSDVRTVNRPGDTKSPVPEGVKRTPPVAPGQIRPQSSPPPVPQPVEPPQVGAATQVPPPLPASPENRETLRGQRIVRPIPSNGNEETKSLKGVPAE